MKYYKVTVVLGVVDDNPDVTEEQRCSAVNSLLREVFRGSTQLIFKGFRSPLKTIVEQVKIIHDSCKSLSAFTEGDLDILSWIAPALSSISIGAARPAARRLGVSTIMNRLGVNEIEADHILTSMQNFS